MGTQAAKALKTRKHRTSPLRLPFPAKLLLIPSFLVLALTLAALAQSPPQSTPHANLKDFTHEDLRHEFYMMKILPAEAKADRKTGFIVGGKNPTELIHTLPEINGKSIPALERAMRPGAYSTAGFLGGAEGLLAVLAADNKYVVDDLDLTHQELARHLYALAAVWCWQLEHKQEGKPFLYHGRRFVVGVASSFDEQPSPFDDGTATAFYVTIFNLDNRKKLSYSLLVPMMIDWYGFYEGGGTEYRVEPRQVLQVLDFLGDPNPLGRFVSRWLVIVVSATVASVSVVWFLLLRFRRRRQDRQAIPPGEPNLPGNGAGLIDLPSFPSGSGSMTPFQS